MKLSNTTQNIAKRYNVELCDSIKNELHFIIDPENNDCASVAYKLENEVYTLSNVWYKNISYPSILKDEKAIRELIKLLVKLC